MPQKLNADQERARRAGELGVFLRQYAHKAHKNREPRTENREPNDRRYYREVTKQVQQLSTEELDKLLRNDEGE